MCFHYTLSTPPPRKDGYYKHIEADNLLTQHSWQSMLGFTSLLTGILMCSQDAKSCSAGIVMTTIGALKKITIYFGLLLD